jgi:Tol biopolymer transport system component
MAGSDLRHERRALTVGVALAVAVAGLGLAVLALRHESAGRPTSEARSSPTGAVAVVGNGVIAFGCGYHVCTVMPDGSGFTDLIEPYDKDLVLAAYSPVFSPDGSKIVFRGYPRSGLAASGGANYDLYVMNADGSGVRNVTTSPDDARTGVSQYYAQWSSDGSMIAYDSDDGGFHVMNADGSDERKIVDGGSPTWSPDGSWIAFVMGRDHGADLWKIHPDGTGLTQLTQSTGSAELPVWSPDGSQIAFLRDRVPYLVNADGTGVTVLADIPGAFPFQPQWSPDGTTLAFEVEMPSETPSDQAGRNYDIFAVNADGSGLIDLTPTTDITENYPIWSPDGSKLAFGASDVLSGVNAGTYDLYTMNPDGTGVDRLTTDAGLGVEFDISWQRALG